MKTLLKIQTSIHGQEAQSSQLADRFVQQWLSHNRGGRVVVRDLAAEPVPHLTAERFQAFTTPVEQRTPSQRAIADYSDGLIAELQQADTVVFAVPMYNFSVPSTLRAYFDHIARAGITFRYGSNGAEGLIKGKSAFVFVTRGGVYSESADTQTAYIRQFLSFVGITNLEFIHAEGLAMGAPVRERSLATARNAIAALSPLASAAA